MTVPAASTSRAPPGPRSRYPGQLALLLARDKLAFFSLMARHGDVAQVRFGPERLVLLMHPDDIRRVLVTDQRAFTKGQALARTRRLLGDGLLTSEGALHLRQRRLVQPALHRERVAGYGHVMADYAQRMLARWEDGFGEAGGVIDLHGEMMRLTLLIAGRTLFDVDVEREAREVRETLALSLRMFRYRVLPVGSLIEYTPLPWVRRLRRARRRLDRLIARLIAERRQAPGERGDLLSLLLEAQDSDGAGGGMIDRQVRDEVVTLLMAGHETTAVALSWAGYLLTQHPAVAATLQAELDAVLGDRPPGPGDVPRLAYTRSVVAEAMRLYPPAWILERRAVADFAAGGYRIPAGSTVYLSPYLVHRDPRWWPEPTRFRPERWAPEASAERPKFSYFPFGGGTRICVGEHFAWLEATLVLAAIAQRWELSYAESAPPVPETLVTLRPRGGVWVRVVRPPSPPASAPTSTCFPTPPAPRPSSPPSRAT